jgi:hypothetical protein
VSAAVATSQQAAMDSAVRYLVTNYSPKGNRVGWLMLASILVEAWDLYAIGFVLIFIRDQYHPDPLLLGLAAAGTQAGCSRWSDYCRRSSSCPRFMASSRTDFLPVGNGAIAFDYR